MKFLGAEATGANLLEQGDGSRKRLGKPGMTGGEMTEPLGMEPLGRAVEMLEIICMKPFGVKVIGMAPLRMELAKLRTAAELLER